ncbi:TIGR03621 family F420-dependent LLM class oxidoreductase [Streptosporangiaceae bacterium NEAU-GS5]|nr:TIGR03621 family F420-dependent LLM class oxidoreductase [Streptosporangiaceae bacterium NEAU-GS5]
MTTFRFAAVIRSAGSAREWADKARRLEDAGYDAVYISDHIVGPRFAPIAAMTAAACATTRLRVGALVLANDFRHPVMLAKEAATLDVLSEGRLDLGLGTGWMAADYQAAGLPLERPGLRVDRLAESVAVLKGLWADGPFTFAGKHYQITELDLQPKPIGPRLLLGGGGARVLTLAGREADVVHIVQRVRADGAGPDQTDTGVAAFLAKIDIVRRAAEGRAVELGTSVLQIGEHKAEESWSAADSSLVADTPQVLLGSLDEIVEKMRRWRDDHGLSFYVLHNERDLDPFNRVVEALSGT